MRTAVAAAVSCIFLGGVCLADSARASIKEPTNIPAQELSAALQKLAHDRHVQVVFASEDVISRRSGGATGDLTIDGALNLLLRDTGLTYRYLDENTVTVVPMRATDGTPTGASSQGSDALESRSDIDISLLAHAGLEADRVNDKANGGAEARGLGSNAAAPRAGEGKGDVDKASDVGTNEVLESVVVTAEKKDETLREVPVPVTVLDTNSLVDNGQVMLRDFYATTPGLVDAPGFENTQLLTIRGITTGGNSIPTVGIVIDDVPITRSLVGDGGLSVPDLDPGDLARIEVLRGPQGTLYGANSMGGLIKYVTVDPSTAGFSGRFEAGLTSVYNGSAPGYNIRGSLNIPISDTLAIRVSGFERQDPGYIDSPYLNINGINQINADGARVAALWRPTDALSIKFGAVYEKLRGEGISEVDIQPGLHGLQQDYSGGVGPYDATTQVYTATINYDFDKVKLTSVTGYSRNQQIGTLDFTFLRSYFQQNYGYDGDIWHISLDSKKVSEELRASGSWGPNLDWQVGGFYTWETEPQNFYLTLENSLTRASAPWPAFWIYDAPGSVYPVYREYAGFANSTYRFTDKFDVQVGLRESTLKQDESVLVETGLWTSLFEHTQSPNISPSPALSQNALTYLGTARYKFSRDWMVYVRLASGYRPGGSNGIAGSGVPPNFGPDKTQNYELGAKGDFFNHLLSLDASVYRIDWTGIQVTRFTPAQIIYTTNGAEAKSQGVELSVTLRPWQGMTIQGWSSYDDAVLTQPFPAGPTYGAAGNPLPNTPKWSANLSLQQEFPLWSSATGFVGGQVMYQGDRKSVFNGFAADGVTPLPRQEFPAYTRTDLRAGIKFDSWSVNAYINNVGNVRGITAGGIGYFNPQAFVYIQPRTIGANIVKTF